MRLSKYYKAFQALAKRIIFTSKDARNVGIPSRMLNYFCSKGWIDRLSRGVYKVKGVDHNEDFEWEDLAITALSIKNGVICLITALYYYELTDEMMREFWIAIPHTTSSGPRENTRLVRMRNTTLGRVEAFIGGHKLSIFDRERTVIDAFRYLDKETAIKALQTYLAGGKEFKPDIKKLLSYARQLRVDISTYITALTT